jgi:hypothetical protein
MGPRLSPMRMRMTTVSLRIARWWCCLAALGLACAALAIASGRPATAATPEPMPEPTPEQVKFFEEKVRPILAENCYKCHGSEAQKGDLRLDLRESALAGGESGPVIVPGKPDESVLVEAIKWESYEMPPTGKLSDNQIAMLTEWIRLGAPMPKDHGGGTGLELRKTRGIITDEDRQWWAFQPIGRPAAPGVQNAEFGMQNAIDAFVAAKLAEQGLFQAPQADRRTLIRRVSFDLVGLPPTPEEIDAFLADERPDAYERLVDRLLASPHHGEHWARHWLDLVRYAESDGYRADAYRPTAWTYRDYVIRAFNRDKPYSQFVQEQLAGDELATGDLDALVATGFLRVGIYEYNQRDVRGQWTNILNDMTDVTADVFLGLGMSCARCHDHKFDPILQTDYYRLQAHFTPLLWREKVPVATPDEIAEYERQMKVWEEATADIREKIAEIERPVKAAAEKGVMVKFNDELQAMMAKSPEERAPLEKQLVYLIDYQIRDGEGKVDFKTKLKGEKKEQWEALQTQLAEFDHLKPAPIPMIASATDVGPVAPPTLVPGKRNAEDILPGPLTVLEHVAGTLRVPSNAGARTGVPATFVSDVKIDGTQSVPTTSTGRRTALAEWITSPDNPLASRVLANRLWQQHFGRGLCESPSDFGRLGQPPSHPELLDWLAAELLDGGWSMKRLHRQMVTSSTYRQASHGPEVTESAAKDPANKWLARMPVRRLSAEQIRDAAIAVTGEIDTRGGGEGGEWGKTARRAIYLKVFRNKQEATLEVFDAADGIFTTPVRNVTTTPTQSLFMINGPWMMLRAKALARRLDQNSSVALEERVATAYTLAFGRPPDANETAAALAFLQTHPAKDHDALVDFCHVLLNSNEFLYVD